MRTYPTGGTVREAQIGYDNDVDTLRTTAAGYALTRVLYGAALVAAPARVGKPWVGKGARRQAAGIALRGLGARDAVLAAGVVAGATGAWDPRPWLVACAVGDVADLSATLAADPEKLPDHGRAKTALAAGVYAATAVGLAVALTRG